MARGRRNLTAAQMKQASDRRTQFADLVERLRGLSDAERAAFASKVGVVLTIEGRSLSPANTALVLMQRPGALVVGGFNQWRAVGRKVKKGERGIMIWVPGGVAKVTRKADGTEERKTNFIMGYVFAQEQTEPIDSRERVGEVACGSLDGLAGEAVVAPAVVKDEVVVPF